MRAVTTDHVLFNECIRMFRPEEIENAETQGVSKGYLLLDFELNSALVFDHFTIEPTIEVQIAGPYSAYIAPVVLPKWNSKYTPHLFCFGLASIASFVFKRPVKAPRDPYLTFRGELEEYSLLELAVQFPILTSGPGSHKRISPNEKSKIIREMTKIVGVLFEIPYDLYITSMQSIRLVHLAHLNHRDDFGLAYYLLISSMEPIAMRAIDKDFFSQKYSPEIKARWKELAKGNDDIKELRLAYYKTQGNPTYIQKRFLEFLFSYCQPEEWMELNQPIYYENKFFDEITGEEMKNPKDENWEGTFPNEFNKEELRGILASMYEHRSKFTHEGQNPPHTEPNNERKFFEEQLVYSEKKGKPELVQVVLPTFQLVSFIAKRSLFNYLDSQLKS